MDDKDPTLLVNILKGPTCHIADAPEVACPRDFKSGPKDCKGCQHFKEKPFGVGSTVYTYDPILFRRGTEEFVVIGETKFSWLVGGSVERPWWKLPKKEVAGKTEVTITINSRMGWRRTFYLTRQALEDERWKGSNRHFIGAAVGRLQDTALLRRIAALIGYVDREKE